MESAIFRTAVKNAVGVTSTRKEVVGTLNLQTSPQQLDVLLRADGVEISLDTESRTRLEKILEACRTGKAGCDAWLSGGDKETRDRHRQVQFRVLMAGMRDVDTLCEGLAPLFEAAAAVVEEGDGLLVPSRPAKVGEPSRASALSGAEEESILLYRRSQ